MEFGPEVHGRGPRQEILDFSENNLTLSVSKQRLPGLGVVGWWVDCVCIGHMEGTTFLSFFFSLVTLRYRCGRLTPLRFHL